MATMAILIAHALHAASVESRAKFNDGVSDIGGGGGAYLLQKMWETYVYISREAY